MESFTKGYWSSLFLFLFAVIVLTVIYYCQLFFLFPPGFPFVFRILFLLVLLVVAVVVVVILVIIVFVLLVIYVLDCYY